MANNILVVRSAVTTSARCDGQPRENNLEKAGMGGFCRFLAAGCIAAYGGKVALLQGA